MKARWSSETPTAPGYYWFLRPLIREAVEIVELKDFAGELQLWHVGWDVPVELGRCKGLWIKAEPPLPPQRTTWLAP